MPAKKGIVNGKATKERTLSEIIIPDLESVVVPPPIDPESGESRGFRGEVALLRRRSEELLEQIKVLNDEQKQEQVKLEEIAEAKQNSTAKELSQREIIMQERYESLLEQVHRARQENAHLKAQIRDLQIKLRDSKLNEETIKDALEISQQQRLHLRPISIQ